MSLNLRLEINGLNYDLQQTPTYVTKMCLIGTAGHVKTRNGKKALRALQIYGIWLLSTFNGVYETQEDLDHSMERRAAAKCSLIELFKEVGNAIKDGGIVTVYGA